MQLLMSMTNMLATVDIETGGIFGGTFMQGVSAWGSSLLFMVLTMICKVLGLFADLLNIAFYVFSGIDIVGTNGQGKYEITVGGEKQNILDYFVLSERMTKAYLWIALASVALIVIFTIYKIIKQDYFDRAGPRSKGPIFRNVAISCISFLLVIPIFWLIIHASSLIAVVLMDLMGFDPSVLAGARVFLLSWSDGGEMVKGINSLYTSGNYNEAFTTMNNLDGRTLFTLLTKKKNLEFAVNLTTPQGKDIVKKALGYSEWSPNVPLAEFGMMVGKTPISGNFYWYIYLVGVVIVIMSLYKMLLAMLQRIYKLMGLFLVAPSAISQYVLDDGQKFKTWLQESIQEGLRLVSATMSFSIFLMALSLITEVSFIDAIQTSLTEVGIKSDTKVVLLAEGYIDPNEINSSNLDQFVDQSIITVINIKKSLTNIATGAANELSKYVTGKTVSDHIFNLADAFFKVFMLIGAGGAIMDLDAVLTPLISGAKSSLDAGGTGAAASGFATKAVSLAASGIGGVVGHVAGGLKNMGAEQAGEDAGAAEADKEGTGTVDDGGSGGGGSGGGGSGDPKDDEEKVETPTDQKDKDVKEETGDEEKVGDEGVEGKKGGDEVGDEKVEGKKDEEKSGEKKDEEKAGEKKADEKSGEKKTKEKDDKNKDKNNNKKTVKPIGTFLRKIGNGFRDIKSFAKKVPGAPRRGLNWLMKKGDKVQGKGGFWNEVGGGAIKGLALAGKLGLGTLKAAGSVVKGIGSGLLSATGSVFKEIFSAVGEGVLGKGTMKAFSEARDKAENKENAAAGKRYEAAKHQGYQMRREEQMKEAEANVKEKEQDVKTSTDQLNNAVNEEKVALEEVDRAEGEHAVNVANAEKSNSEVEAKNYESTTTKINNHKKEIEKLDKKNGTTYDEVKEQVEMYESVMKDKNAKPLSKKEKEDYKACKTQYDEYRKHMNHIENYEKQLSESGKNCDIVTGKDGLLNELGYNDPEMKSSDIKKSLDTRKAEIEKKLPGASEEEKAKLIEEKSKIERATSALDVKVREGNREVSLYDSKEAKKAREDNHAVIVSGENVNQKREDLAKKHGETEKAKQNVTTNVKALNNATKVATALTGVIANSPYVTASVDTKAGVDANGNYVRPTKAPKYKVNSADILKRKSEKVKDVVDNSGGSVVEAVNGISLSEVAPSTATVNQKLDKVESYHNDQITQLGIQRDNNINTGIANLVAGTKTISYGEGNKSKKKVNDLIKPDTSGKYNVANVLNTLDTFKKENNIGDDNVEFNNLYTGIQNLNTTEQNKYIAGEKIHKDAISKVGTARGVLRACQETYAMEHGGVTNLMTKLDNQYQTNAGHLDLCDKILNGNSGFGVNITEKDRNILREYSGVNIGKQPAKNSTKSDRREDEEQLKKAATKARAKLAEEQNNIQTEQKGLKGKSDELTSSLVSAITSALETTGIKVNVEPANSEKETKGKGTNGGEQDSNKKAEGVQGPTSGQNVTNINNNNTNVIEEEGQGTNKMPAASGLGQSVDWESYYERMQVEGIKQMQVMLETVKLRNEQIKDDLEIIKREIQDFKN